MADVFKDKFTALSDQKEHDGKAFTVIKGFEAGDHHDAEVGRMFLIRLDDGQEIEAFEDEVLVSDPKIEEMYHRIINGDTVTTHDKDIYESLCNLLARHEVDFVSGDIDPLYPDEPYYVELNG